MIQNKDRKDNNKKIDFKNTWVLMKKRAYISINLVQW